MLDSQQGVQSQVDYNHLVFNKCEWNNDYCYMPRLSLNKTSTVIG